MLPHLTVEICALVNDTCAGPAIAAFNSTNSRGSNNVRVNAVEEQYIVNWSTSQDMDPVPNYRLTVSAIGRVVGTLDLDVVPSGGDKGSVDASRFVAVVAGSSVPIKFRIEQGGFLAVGPEGGRASFSGGAAEISIPAGALSAPVAFFVDPVRDEPEASAGLVPGTVFDVTPSPTALSTPARLWIRYAEEALGNIPESRLTILKKLGAVWVEADDAVIDDVANTVSVEVDGFSRWAIGCKMSQLVVTPGSADLNLGLEEVAQFSATANCVTTDGGARAVQHRLITWFSNSPAGASVDANTGLVTALALGEFGVMASSPRACSGRWPTVPASATPCIPLQSGFVDVAVFRLEVTLDGDNGIEWRPNLRFLGAKRRFTAKVKRLPWGAPPSQAVVWSTSNGAASVSADGVVTAQAAGSANIIARAVADPGAMDQKAVIVTAGPRLTAINVKGDIEGFSIVPSLQEWDGMDYPAAFEERGLGGHLQGVAKVGDTYVLSHSRDANRGLMIYGSGTSWNFVAPSGGNLGNHPGGIQASGDVVVVPNWSGAFGKINFYQASSTGLTPLSHLTITHPAGTGEGTASGIAYHPAEDRWYVIDGVNAEFGSAPHRLYRTKPGLALADPTNCFTHVDSVNGICTDAPYKLVNAFGSQGAMQLLWDEQSSTMALIALYRPDFLGVDPFAVNQHAVKGTWIDPDAASGATGVEFLSRSDFLPTFNMPFSASFRMASGLLLDANGRVTIIATERCTSFQGPGVNSPPCGPGQDKVDFFTLGPP